MNSTSVLHHYLILGLWLAWLIYWLVASRGNKEVAQRESPASRASHGIPLMIGAWLMFAQRVPWPALNERFVPFAEWLFVAGAILVALGLAFSVWARVYLGGNWSGTVTLKRGHELVRSGPYRFVRNPIYTGLIVAFIGSALARGQWSSVLGVVIAFGAVWHKSRIEERVLHDAFGRQYDDYKRDTASLIPFVL